MPVIAASNDGSDRVSNGATGDSESDGEIGDSAGPGSAGAGPALAGLDSDEQPLA